MKTIITLAATLGVGAALTLQTGEVEAAAVDPVDGQLEPVTASNLGYAAYLAVHGYFGPVYLVVPPDQGSIIIGASAQVGYAFGGDANGVLPTDGPASSATVSPVAWDEP
jgi:hypothetical protein